MIEAWWVISILISAICALMGLIGLMVTAGDGNRDEDEARAILGFFATSFLSLLWPVALVIGVVWFFPKALGTAWKDAGFYSLGEWFAGRKAKKERAAEFERMQTELAVNKRIAERDAEIVAFKRRVAELEEECKIAPLESVE